MRQHDIWLCILLMGAVTILIKALPVTLIRGRIRNRYVRSFLYYVPYVTLSVMTFPAIIHATQKPVSGLLALIGGVLLAFKGGSLPKVAALCCAIVFFSELLPL